MKGTALLEHLLQNEIEFRDRIIHRAEISLRGAPPGKLSVSKSHGRAQYRHRLPGEKPKYIPVKQVELARKLAQKEYDEDVIAIAKREQILLKRLLIDVRNIGPDYHPQFSPNATVLSGGLDRCLSNNPCYRFAGIEECYNRLSLERKALIVPHVAPCEAIVESWKKELSRSAPLNSGVKEFATESGIAVRSKSEVIIADKLFRKQIPFGYEQPIRFESYYGKTSIIYPDFLIYCPKTNKEVIWEHFGMMGDTDYQEKALAKLAYYAECGFFPSSNLITTFESSDRPLNPKTVDAVVERLLI